MKAITTFLLFCFILFSAVAQEENSESEKAYAPTIGVGVSSIGFYGDVNDHQYSSPITGNPGVNVYLLQPVTDFLNVRFNFMVGKIREEERSIERNVNFETSLRTGALYLEYNFDHFLPEQRKITPFIATGIEVVEFNPKSDFLAYGGEPYNYWADGTIRSLPENSPQAENAVIIRRDYTYETDIREAGLNNSTDYLERSFAIPLGIGVTMHLNDQFDFRLQSTMHFTFTDYIDGITPNTDVEYVGGRKGNDRNDKFIVSGVSLSYNFQKVEGAEPLEFYDKDEPIDYLAYGNTEDFDGDGIIDLIDNCPNTPEGVSVDSLGCPIDTDKDGIPDYKDEEINTEYPEFANDKGVEMTNQMIYESYLRYKDSTLELAEVIERDFTKGGTRSNKKYRVKVGEYEQGETPEDMSKLLSLSDLGKIDQGDKTIFTAGNYKTLVEASVRANELKEQGFNEAEVLKKGNRGDYAPTSPSAAVTTSTTSESNTPSTPKEPAEDMVVFRVQLGAFKNKPDQAAFDAIPNLFVVESGGYYRYMSGSFRTFADAARHKVKMVVEDYKGAFVVAYKNGKRVSLQSVGVNPISSDPIIGK
jgi:hypothetical protein